MSVPKTEDILGVEPRYHLRSGYAGLHIKNDNEDRVSSFYLHLSFFLFRIFLFQITDYFQETTEKLSRYKNEKRKQKTTNICNNSFKNFWLDGNLDNYKHFQETLENVFREVDDIKGIFSFTSRY